MDVVVVSPKRPVYEGEAKSLSVETADGQMGVLQGHAAIVAALGVGPLRITRADGNDDKFAVWGGFVKVGDSRVTILVDRALRSDEVDAESAKQQLTETIAQLQHPASDEDYETLMQRRSWCQTQLKIAKEAPFKAFGAEGTPPQYQ